MELLFLMFRYGLDENGKCSTIEKDSVIGFLHKVSGVGTE